MINNIKSICILRLSAIGDVTHVLPVIATLQKAYPEAKITWVIGKFEYKTVYDKKIHWSEINDNIKINLYRILQEALQNIIKYAHASSVEIEFKLKGNTLNLLIKDNGKGFDIFEKRKGIGIKNMKSRVRKLNGTFEINSTFNKGTVIFVSCPIQS